MKKLKKRVYKRYFQFVLDFLDKENIAGTDLT